MPSITRRTLTLLVLLVLAGPPAAAHAQAKPKAQRSPAAVVQRDLSGLRTAILRARALPPDRRRALARRVAAARTDVRRGRACPAVKKLLQVRKALRRQARGSRARRRAAARLAVRATRARGGAAALAPGRRACGGPTLVDVDPALRPAARTVRGPDGRARPLARLTDGSGDPADFVADAVVLSTSSQREVDAFLRRWRGTLVRTVDVPGGGADLHFIRVDARRADTGRLPARLQALSRTRGQSLVVSSGAATDLLALVAAETAAGRKVALDWVGRGGGLADGFTVEAPGGPGGFSLSGAPWSRNAFDWVHLADGGPQATGVAGAWRLLSSAGRLVPGSVRLAILDMGFAPAANGEFGPDPIFLSNVPFVDATRQDNLSSCTGGSPCPWHGTSVLNAAMAPPDNGMGVAGPGGPVARAVPVFTLYDMFSGIAALTQAYAAGARIANMSYGVPVPAAVSFINIPFNDATAIFKALGMTMYAAAGNDATDVDATDCIFDLCWEETWFTPCENAGVTCIGATAAAGTAPACYSNWGDADVDLWAPGTVLVGNDPRGGGVRASNGTSVASPWTAGVHALLRAAAPTVPEGVLDGALRRTARAGGSTSTGCDGSRRETRRTTRFVDAGAAVRDVLDPVLRITAPAGGTSQRRGAPIGFSAFLYDDGRGPATIEWRVDGAPAPFATGERVSARDLPYGTNRVIASATLRDGTVVADAVTVTVTNDAPRVEITAPAPGTSVFRASTVVFRAVATDVNEDDGRLPDGRLQWFLDDARTPFGTGPEVSRSMADVPAGDHVARVVADDGHGGVAEATVRFTVQENPPDLPPTVRITSPSNGQVFTVEPRPDHTGKYYKDVTFTTSASDPGGGPVTYSWQRRRLGGPVETMPSTSANPTFRMYFEPTCGNTVYDVTVTVRDSAGQPATDTVRVEIGGVPC